MFHTPWSNIPITPMTSTTGPKIWNTSAAFLNDAERIKNIPDEIAHIKNNGIASLARMYAILVPK